jgi:hypothetical protein
VKPKKLPARQEAQVEARAQQGEEGDEHDVAEEAKGQPKTMKLNSKKEGRAP